MAHVGHQICFGVARKMLKSKESTGCSRLKVLLDLGLQK